MNLNHPDIQTYLQKTPPVVQKCITSTEWGIRISGIGQKYSLTPAQTNDLEMEILLVALGVEPDEDLITNIKNQLNISETLAEQLADDVNESIYQWIYKKLNNEKETPENLDKKSLDIPPPNLPSEDLAEETPVIRANQEPLVPAQKTIHTILQEQVTPPLTKPAQTEESYSLKTAPIQQPTSVTPPPPAPRPSFIENKLSQPIKPASLVPPPRSYTSDPYREPLE